MNLEDISSGATLYRGTPEERGAFSPSFQRSQKWTVNRKVCAVNLLVKTEQEFLVEVPMQGKEKCE